MIDLLSRGPAQLLAQTLLHFLWQGAAVALLLFLIDPLLRTVQNKYAASLGAMLLMLALPAATCYLLVQRESGQASGPSYVGAASGTSMEIVQIPQAALTRWQPLFVGLWLTGVSLLAARLLVGYTATLWLRRDRRPLPSELAHKVAWLGRRLGVATRCRVFLSARVTEAIAVGCFKPLVLIPLAWATELPPSALEAVIAHELAHIRRWDLWITLVQRLAETLLFYHPAVWWLSRRLSQQRELCCDALAVSATRSPADYVLALETIARRTSAPPLTGATAFLGGGKMNLLDRVRHVLAGSPREASAWWPAGLAALAAPLLAALAVGGWSLLPSAVTADDERDAPTQTRAAGDADGTTGLIEAAIQFLGANVGNEDGDEPDESDEADEAAVQRKLETVRAEQELREQDLRAAREALAREAKRLEKLQEEVIRKRDSKRRGDDFDLSDFKPETDREARLLAVIKKLQSQVKGDAGMSERLKKESSQPQKKGPTESKDSNALSEFSKAFGEKRGQDYESYRQALAEKALAEKALAEKEFAIAREREAKERAVQEYKRALREAIIAKEREAKEHDIRGQKEKQDLVDAEKDAHLRALKDREEIERQQKAAAAAAERDALKKQRAEKEARARKDRAAAEAVNKLYGGPGSEEVDSLRRALRAREAELEKLHEALERMKKVAPDKEGIKKGSSETKDSAVKESRRHETEGGQLSELQKTFDDYVRLRLDGIEIVLPEKEAGKRE